VLAGGIREIAGEVRNSLDFHRSQDGGGEVSSVVLSGPALEIGGFAAALEAELGFQVQRRTVDVARDSALDGLSADRLAIATGLAVQEVAQ
jgi:type IV pilus assembly protein PilM